MAAWTPTEATVSLSGRGCRVRACRSDRVLGLCSAPSRSRDCCRPAQLTQQETSSEGGAQRGGAQGQRGGDRQPRHWLGHGAG